MYVMFYVLLHFKLLSREFSDEDNKVAFYCIASHYCISDICLYPCNVCDRLQMFINSFLIHSSLCQSEILPSYTSRNKMIKKRRRKKALLFVSLTLK